MYQVKYQHFLRAILSVTALTFIEPVVAMEINLDEADTRHTQTLKVDLPQHEVTNNENEFGGSNLIGATNAIFHIKPSKNEWEYKEPEDQTTDRKYNLVGIALFAGRDPISNGIKVLTNSNYSHVGVILSDVKDERKWFCFESTGTKGEVLKWKYPHVRTAPWDEVVKKYDGNVSYRLFVYPQNMERIDLNEVTGFTKKYNGKSYTKNPLRLLKALFKANNKSESEALKTVFCSELTAKMLMELGVIEEGVASNYIPKDFTIDQDRFLDSAIPLSPEFKEK